MQIIWQGTDITGYVMVRNAVMRDACGERCDGLDIEFENAESWYRWGPQEDDEIRVTMDGWDSGKMYLNTIAPGDGRYRVIATSLPCTARTQKWRSYEGKTIEGILMQCGAETGMDWQTWGVDGKTVIPYIQQENEGSAAFLHRLALLEGARLKCCDGRYVMIGLDYAQQQEAVTKLAMSAEQDGFDYRRCGRKESGLVLLTPYARGQADDSDVSTGKERPVMTCYPAMSNAQAARWARNLLTETNRKCEKLILRTTFNPSLSAMCRVDIEGNTDAAGEWLIDEAEHDLKNRTSSATMYRCITGIR